MSGLKLHLLLLLGSLIIIIAFLSGCASEEPEEYEVEVQAAPEEAGEVTGEGLFEEGEEITVEATPKEGYEFDGWEQEGEQASSSEEYTLVVESNKNLVASFTEVDFEVNEGEDGEAFEKVAEVPINISQGSPQGDYLLNKQALGLNGPIYSILSLEKWDYKRDWDEQPDNAVGNLPMLGGSDDQGPTYPPRVSPDGSKLAYSTREVVDYEATGRAAIYVVDFSLPVEIKHKIDLNGDELASWSIPGWKPNSEGLYYVTPDEVMSYSFEEQEPMKILPTTELSGLIQNNEGRSTINPHAFNITNETSQIAYVDYGENSIKVFCLEKQTEEKEVKLETTLKEKLDFGNQLEFLLDGNFLALRQGLIIETQTGNKIDFDDEGDILSYACDGDERLIIVVGKEYGEGYKLELKLFNNELEKKDSLSTLAPNIDNVEVATHKAEWLIGIDSEVYYLEFN